jgi:hypothetical protein
MAFDLNEVLFVTGKAFPLGDKLYEIYQFLYVESAFIQQGKPYYFSSSLFDETLPVILIFQSFINALT